MLDIKTSVAKKVHDRGSTDRFPNTSCVSWRFKCLGMVAWTSYTRNQFYYKILKSSLFIMKKIIKKKFSLKLANIMYKICTKNIFSSQLIWSIFMYILIKLLNKHGHGIRKPLKRFCKLVLIITHNFTWYKGTIIWYRNSL